MYLAGLEPGISSRGWGSLQRAPGGEYILVQHDWALITFDFTAWNNILYVDIHGVCD